jgi:hypothetical protein
LSGGSSRKNFQVITEDIKTNKYDLVIMGALGWAPSGTT